MGYDPLRDTIKKAVAEATRDIYTRDMPRVVVSIYGQDNAAYDDEGHEEEGLGLLVLGLDIEKAVRRALDNEGGTSTVWDAYGNTVGDVVTEEVTP